MKKALLTLFVVFNFLSINDAFSMNDNNRIYNKYTKEYYDWRVDNLLSILINHKDELDEFDEKYINIDSADFDLKDYKIFKPLIFVVDKIFKPQINKNNGTQFLIKKNKHKSNIISVRPVADLGRLKEKWINGDKGYCYTLFYSFRNKIEAGCDWAPDRSYWIERRSSHNNAKIMSNDSWEYSESVDAFGYDHTHIYPAKKQFFFTRTYW